MKQYRVIGLDAKDERLFDIVVEAPNQAVARMMVLAQMCRNFATVPLADRADKARHDAGVLAASVAVVTSIAFSIDTTLRIGAACYLLIAAPAVLLVFAGARSSHTVLRSLHPSKTANV